MKMHGKTRDELEQMLKTEKGIRHDPEDGQSRIRYAPGSGKQRPSAAE